MMTFVERLGVMVVAFILGYLVAHSHEFKTPAETSSTADIAALKMKVGWLEHDVNQLDRRITTTDSALFQHMLHRCQSEP